MKYYKDGNNQVYAYEEWMPEFGSYTEQEITNEDGSVTVEKIYPEFTVKEGLIAITQAEADLLRNPPKSDDEIKAEILATNTATQAALIKEANAAMELIQDAIDLDMQEEGDEVKLKEWKKYRVLLSRMDLTDENMELPVRPD